MKLGTDTEDSIFAICETVAAMAKPARSIAVGLWQDDNIYEQAKTQNQAFASFKTFLRKASAEALADVEDGSVDLLHIDVRHIGDSAKATYED